MYVLLQGIDQIITTKNNQTNRVLSIEQLE
jgi:hypothetical protein